MNLKWMRIPAAAYNGFFRIAGGCRSGRNHLFVLLFRDIEQVEAVVRYRSDAVVFHGDRTGQGVVVPEQASAVEAVEQVVGELQHPPGQPVLQVEHVETGDAPNAPAVFFVVFHDSFVAENTEGFHRRKGAAEQVAELVGIVFPDVPGVACQRHTDIGGGQDELAARTQHAVHFPYQFHVVFDVFDHLERNDEIETARWQVERGNYGLPHLHVRERRPFARRFDFVEREKAGGVGGDYFDAVTRARTYFEYVAADSPRRLVIGQLRTLEYVVVRYVARYALRREYFSHCARSVLHRSA